MMNAGLTARQVATTFQIQQNTFEEFKNAAIPSWSSIKNMRLYYKDLNKAQGIWWTLLNHEHIF